MAKKIRFPLKMKNGAEVRTLDELKENFDLESVLGYFTDGKLSTWLADRYYDEKAEAVAALSADMPDLNAKLCDILEVEYEAEVDETDVDLIARRREKLQIISGVTDNREILDNIDLVAMDQDELFDILDESPEKVYLYGDKFEIPFGKKNISYIGVNNPLVIIESGKYVFEYNEKGITFKNVSFDKLVDPSITRITQYLREERYEEAFPIVKEAAEKGDSSAQFFLGCMYDNGDGVEKDKSKAFEWFRKAAEQGDASSQYNLANMYSKGDGITKDMSKAFEWFRKAAEQGDASSQYNLGVLYAKGNGVEKDKSKAFEWFRKAAEQGDASSQYNLANMYSKGDGITKDMSKAFEWFRKAAEQGNVSSQYNLGFMYEKGIGVEVDYFKAAQWYGRAACNDDEEAERMLNQLAKDKPEIIFKKGIEKLKETNELIKKLVDNYNSSYTIEERLSASEKINSLSDEVTFAIKIDPEEVLLDEKICLSLEERIEFISETQVFAKLICAMEMQ